MEKTICYFKFGSMKKQLCPGVMGDSKRHKGAVRVVTVTGKPQYWRECSRPRSVTG